MTDIGDDVDVTTTIEVGGTPTDPDTVVLQVTDPAGITSTPAVTNPSVGVYEAKVPATLAGRWRTRWTATDPDGIEYGYFDVQADPPGRLDPLASISDLEDRIGTLTAEQAQRAPALLSGASARVRAYCRQNFDLTEGDTAVLRPVGTSLVLPQRPVLAVSSVVAVSGNEEIPDVTLSGWQWDGIDEVNVYGLSDVVLNLPEWYGDLATGPRSYRVTYNHGYPSTPDDVVDVVCSMVNRILTAPTMAEGMASERAGPFAYQMGQGGGTPGPAVRLTQEDKDALADAGYRRRSGTIQVRA